MPNPIPSSSLSPSGAIARGLHRDAGGVERLRLRLVLVLLVGMLPLLAYLLVSAETTRHATLDWLEAELGDAARQAADHEAAALGQAARLLESMAAVAQTAPARALCAELRPRLAGGPVGLVGLALHGADGAPICATRGGQDEASVAALAVGTAHVRAALAAPARVTMAAEGGDLVLARRLDGANQGMVLALVLAPSHLPPLSLSLRRDQVARLLVDPDDGMVLAEQRQSDLGSPRVGVPLQQPRLLAALRSGLASGVVVSRDAAGLSWLTGYAALPAGVVVFAGQGVMVVELPYDALRDEADARRRDQWLAALTMFLLGMVGAWVLAQGSMVHPLRTLLGRPAQMQRQNLAALRPAGEWLRQQADLAAVVVAAGEMFLRLDGGLRVVYASPSTRAVLGYAPSEVVDADLAAEPGWGPCQDLLTQLRQDGAAPGRGVAPGACRIVARRRDDAEVKLEVRASRLADGGFMLVCRDIGPEEVLRAELGETRARLAALGPTDMESGLANRRRFDDALAEELRRARRAQEPLSLVLLRLADAKDVEAVRRVGRIMSAMLRRPGDLAARLEGDLFAVLLPTTDRIGVQRLAERLHESVAAELSQAAWTGACSMLPQSDADDPQSVLDLAHQALREATGQGGAGVALSMPAPERVAS